MRMPTPILTLLDNLGAFGASAVSVVGVSSVAVGQVPIPSGIPAEWVMILLGVGPALAWFLVRVLGAMAAYYAAIKTTSRKRVEALMALTQPERGPDSGPLIIRLLDEADDAEAKEAALNALGRGAAQAQLALAERNDRKAS